jgi:hypothetical protein
MMTFPRFIVTSLEMDAKLDSPTTHSGQSALAARKRAFVKADVLSDHNTSSMGKERNGGKRILRRVKSARFGSGKSGFGKTSHNKKPNDFSRWPADRSKPDSACLAVTPTQDRKLLSQFSFKTPNMSTLQTLNKSWHSELDNSVHAPRLPRRQRSNDFGALKNSLPPSASMGDSESNSLQIKNSSDHQVIRPRSTNRRIPCYNIPKPLSDRTLITLDNQSSFTSKNYNSVASMEYLWPGHATVIDEPPESNSPRKPRRRLSNDSGKSGSELSSDEKISDNMDITTHSAVVFEDPYQLLMGKTKTGKNPKVQAGVQSCISSVSDDEYSTKSSESGVTYASFPMRP